MGVIPGTHLNDSYAYEQLDTTNKIFTKEIERSAIKSEEIQWFELEPNQFSLHDSRIIHGANANISEQRRTGFTMRYFDLSMKFQKDHPSNKNKILYHARGENIADNPLVYP